MAIGFLILIVLVFILTFAAEDSQAATIVVAQDGNGDYTSIQEAINASEDGDTIQVYDGIYYENVTIDKSIDLVGNGSILTIINSSFQKYKTTITVNVTIDGVKISGFKITGNYHDAGLIGIWIESNNNTITNNLFSNLRTGLIINSSRGNRVFNNSFINNRNGITITNSLHNNISNNLYNDNEDYGIVLTRSNNNLIIENDCYFQGYDGIRLDNSNSNTISNNDCSNNHWAGIKIRNSIENSIANNTCLYNKDGITLSSSNGNTLMNNTCSYNARSGIHLYFSEDNYLVDNNNSNNQWKNLWIEPGEDSPASIILLDILAVVGTVLCRHWWHGRIVIPK